MRCKRNENRRGLVVDYQNYFAESKKFSNFTLYMKYTWISGYININLTFYRLWC